MARYQKGNRLQDHSLEEVFKAYGVSREVDFVKTFFTIEEVNTILESCGLPLVDSYDRTLEHEVKVGKNTKRADLTFQVEDNLYYFEVMSQTLGGKWDSDHHEQIMTKTFKFGLDYGPENVHTFAIAFKEFDAMYLDDIQKMDNGYAVHLRFNNSGYYADVYGIEEKKSKKSVKLGTLEAYGQKIMDSLKFVNRRSKPAEGRYLYIGKTHPETQKDRYAGIELVMYTGNENIMGIKLHSAIRRIEKYQTYGDNLEQVIKEVSSICPGFSDKNPQVSRGGTITFDFSLSSFTDEDIKELECIVEAYAEVCECKELLS